MSRSTVLALAFVAACSGAAPAEDAPAKAPAAAAATTSGGWDPLPPVVATVAGADITAADLDGAVMGDVIELRTKLYEARKGALEQMIAERLLEAEAKKKNQSVEDYLKAEVEAKVTPATDAEVDAFYAQNQGRIRGTLDEVREPVREHLTQQKQGDAMKALLDQLRKDAQVVVKLDPPRFPVEPGDAPRLGKKDAPVQIVEFSDFECPYCGIAAKTVHDLSTKYGDKIAISFLHFPLPMHPNAPKAAEASLCANEQGKFWEYHDQLFANQRMLDPLSLVRYATDLGLDVAAFQRCLESGEKAKAVEADVAKGKTVGMSGTPGFYVNGIHISGALPVEAFSEIIDAELAR